MALVRVLGPSAGSEEDTCPPIHPERVEREPEPGISRQIFKAQPGLLHEEGEVWLRRRVVSSRHRGTRRTGAALSALICPSGAPRVGAALLIAAIGDPAAGGAGAVILTWQRRGRVAVAIE